MTDFNRFAVKDDKVVEIVGTDPEITREIVSLDPRRVAAELNAAFAAGYRSCRSDVKRVLAIP